MDHLNRCWYSDLIDNIKKNKEVLCSLEEKWQLVHKREMGERERENNGPIPYLVLRSRVLLGQRYVNLWRTWMGSFPKSPQIPDLVFPEAFKVSAAVKKQPYHLHKGPPHVTVHVMIYHTQKSANHILVYPNDTLWGGLLHKVWLNVATLPKWFYSCVTFIVTGGFHVWPRGLIQTVYEKHLLHALSPLPHPARVSPHVLHAWFAGFQLRQNNPFFLSFFFFLLLLIAPPQVPEQWIRDFCQVWEELVKKHKLLKLSLKIWTHV